MKTIIYLGLALGALVSGASDTWAQPTPSREDSPVAYEKVTQERAAKIVGTLEMADTNRADRVRDMIAQQYQDLSRIHETRDERIKQIRNSDGIDKAADPAIQVVREDIKSEQDSLHAAYLEKLSAELSPEQVEKVKDGMTYGVAPLTYSVYLRMYPELNEAQKKQLLDWLLEAREIAMDAGTSNEKHAVFGKYKGRINNYLVKAGYDLKQGEQNLKAARPPASNSTKK